MLSFVVSREIVQRHETNRNWNIPGRHESYFCGIFLWRLYYSTGHALPHHLTSPPPTQHTHKSRDEAIAPPRWKHSVEHRSCHKAAVPCVSICCIYTAIPLRNIQTTRVSSVGPAKEKSIEDSRARGEVDGVWSNGRAGCRWRIGRTDAGVPLQPAVPPPRPRRESAWVSAAPTYGGDWRQADDGRCFVASGLRTCAREQQRQRHHPFPSMRIISSPTRLRVAPTSIRAIKPTTLSRGSHALRVYWPLSIVFGGWWRGSRSTDDSPAPRWISSPPCRWCCASGSATPHARLWLACLFANGGCPDFGPITSGETSVNSRNIYIFSIQSH